MSIAGAINQIINERFNSLWTIAPFKVLSVDRLNFRCDLKMKYTYNGVDVLAPAARIWFPRGGDSIIMYPIKEGDTVLVLFSKINLKTAIVDDKYRDADTIVSYSLEDAIVLGAFVLDSEFGEAIYDDENYEVPEHGLNLISDEKVKIDAPCIDLPLPVLSGSEEGEDTTTAGAYVQSFRFSTTLEIKPYIAFFMMEVTNSTDGQGVCYRLQKDDSSSFILTEGIFSPVTGDQYLTISGHLNFNETVAGAHNFDFDFCRTGSGTAKIRRKRIDIFKTIVCP